MNEKNYYSAEDIAKMLSVRMGRFYKILREMNKDLQVKDFSQSLERFWWSILRKNGMEEQSR